MDLIEQIKDQADKIALFFGFILVFSFGFFSGYFYLIDRNNASEKVAVEEPSEQCSNLIKASPVLPDPVKNEISLEQNSLGSSKNTEKRGKRMFVASKNSKIFHKADCSYAQKIKEENKVWFESPEEATNKGFGPHNLCFK